MLFLTVSALLAAFATAESQRQYYSFSRQVGPGKGSVYSITGEGRITAVRVWEASNKIKGFQFRYGPIWSQIAGKRFGAAQKMELFEGEAIAQISGKYASFLQSVVFVTNRGRLLSAGQPQGRSFNMYPANSRAELLFISGRTQKFITSIAAHWAVVDPASNSSTRKRTEDA